MSDVQEKTRSKYLGTIAWVVGFAILLTAVYFLGKTLLGKSGAAKPSLKQITMVRIQTPPPPPPKPPEKLPEPPPKQEVKIDQPKPQETPKPVDEPPPQAKLGVDAAATGDGDNFGLGSNVGGRDLVAGVGGTGTGTGTIGGTSSTVGTRAQYSFYRDVLVRHLNDLLAKIPELKEQDSSIPIAIWVSKTGRIEKIDVNGANLSPERTEILRKALLNGPTLRQLPPDNMPQPLRVRIKVQDAG
jgi:periplasmic protein TonB